MAWEDDKSPYDTDATRHAKAMLQQTNERSAEFDRRYSGTGSTQPLIENPVTSRAVGWAIVLAGLTAWLDYSELWPFDQLQLYQMEHVYVIGGTFIISFLIFRKLPWLTKLLSTLLGWGIWLGLFAGLYYLLNEYGYI